MPNQHPDLYKSLSYLLERSLPEFVKTSHATFIAFLEAYFAWMEETGQAQEIITQFNDYKDIDKTVDSFLDYFRKNYFESIPKNVLVDKRLLAKHVKDLYAAKGAIPAYKLLFRIMFNETVEVSYPGDDILRPSDGKWIQEQIIHTTSNTSSDVISSTKITGETSGAVGIVESVIRTQNPTNSKVLENYAVDATPANFSRASVASRYNANGELEIVANNVARINYDPFDKSRQGLLIEPTRTNIIPYSNDMTNVAWTVERAFVFSNIQVGSSGANDADKLTDTTDSGVHYVSPKFNVVSGTTYSYSIYVRKEEISYVQLKFTNAHFDDNAYLTVNLNDGSVHNVGNGLIDYQINPVQHGYYHISITATADTTASNSQVFTYLYNLTTESIDYVGVGGQGVYISNAQLETHEPDQIPSSYIPTDASAVTRAAEKAIYTNLATAFESDKGTMFLGFERFKLLGAMGLLQLTNGSTSSITFSINDADHFEVDTEITGTTTTFTYGDSNDDGLGNVAYAYQNHDHVVTANGNGTFTTNTSIGVPAGLNALTIGQTPDNALFHGHIKAFAFYVEKQTNAELTTETADGSFVNAPLPIVSELYLSKIFGNFVDGERILYTDANGVTHNEDTIYTIYAGVNIVHPGSGYQVNDEIRIIETATNIIVATGSVSNITPAGGIRTVDMTNFGIVLPSAVTVQIITSHGTGATLTPKTGILGNFAGRWVGTYGQLSSDKKLQDNLFWQDYSYVLQSNVNVDTFNDIVKEIIHPAGFQLFGELFSEASSVDVIDIHDLTLDVKRIIERIKIIFLSDNTMVSVVKALERILESPFILLHNIEDIRIVQRWNMIINEYWGIVIDSEFDTINEGVTPDISVYGVGTLQPRPALNDRRKFSMIQTIS